MQFLPYTGKQQTFVTTLSVDECLRRLREDVRDPPLGFWKWRGYMAVHHAHDDIVLRKITDHTFVLVAWPFDPRFRWQLIGQIERKHDTTMITGQYRLDVPSRLTAFSLLGIFLAVTVALLVALILMLVGGRTPIDEMVLLLGFIVVLVVLLLLGNDERTKAAQAEEKRLLAVLQQVVEAEAGAAP
jgi:hypothetical protein